MKQKFKFMAMMLMGILLGVNSLWAVDDVLTRATTGVNNGATSYSNWDNKSVTSSAVYAGNSAGSNDAIQLRTTNSNSGVVTTTSGGKAKKVTVEWQSSTTNGRTLDVYGKSTAYSAASDLYNSTNQGTKLGSIVKGTSTELTITGEYEYIGLRSNSGAMYLTSITIEWESGETVSYNVTWTVEGNSYTEGTPTSEVTSGNKVTTLPAAPTSSCEGTFAGWVKSDNGVVGKKPSNEYATDPTPFTTAAASPDITEDTEFVAVFKKEQ